MNLTMQRASINDAPEVAVMVGELLNEIMSTIGVQAFNFSLEETTARLKDFIARTPTGSTPHTNRVRSRFVATISIKSCLS